MSEDRVIAVLREMLSGVSHLLPAVGINRDDMCWFFVQNIDYDPELIDMADVIEGVLDVAA